MIPRSARPLLLIAGLLALTLTLPAHGQVGRESLPDPVPPPLPPPAKPKDAHAYEPIVASSDQPWGLEAQFLAPLFGKAADYAAYILRFTTNETARLADYDESGSVSRERTRRYGYLLLRDSVGRGVREYRQELDKDGSIRQGEVQDREPFPPAYAWVFLFSRFNEPYLSYRYLGERFDGFDWVHEVQFRGSLPFTDGKDIRQWEGVVLVDAVTHTPLEIRAEPSGQAERIDALYRQWSSSFNVLGQRTGPKPLGYRALVQFRHRDRESGLTFPTEMRYDTFRAVGQSRVLPVQASTRSYGEYRIVKIDVQQRVGEQVEP